MDDLLREIRGRDRGVRETLALLGDFADVDGLLRAELHAAQAADAVFAEAGLSADKLDVVARADPYAGAAADAIIIGLEVLDVLHVQAGKTLALERKHGLFGRLVLAALHGAHCAADLQRLAVDPRLRRLFGRGRDREAVGHQPDAGGVIADRVPVVQADDLVDLVQAAAHVAGKLLHGEFVGVGRDFDRFDVALHVAGQAAAVAGEHKAHTLGLGSVCFHRIAAHHDDVGVAQDLSDALCHVQAMAGAGIAINDVFCHNRFSPSYVFPATEYQMRRRNASRLEKMCQGIGSAEGIILRAA